MPDKLFGRALVVRGGALGDFLLTLPVLRALRESSHHLEVLAYPQFCSLAREAGLVVSGRSIEYGPLAGFFAPGSIQDPALRDYFGSFDLVLSYLYDPDGIFANNARASGVKIFVQGPHKPEAGRHAVDQLAAPLETLGVMMSERAVEILGPRRAATAPMLALHPSSGSGTKNWPTGRWEKLAEELLAAHTHLDLAIIGGEADDSALESLGTLRANKRVQFWHNLSLTELAKQMGSAIGYIGHDTGVSHLAAVLGIPSLLLFGPTDPAVWAPPHHHAYVLRAPEADLSRLKVATVLAAFDRQIPVALLA